MTWIQLASRRFTFEALLAHHRQQGQAIQTLTKFEMLGVAAVYTGDEESLRKVLEDGRAFFEGARTRLIEPELLTNLVTLGNLVTATCLYHLAGEDQTAVWRKNCGVASQ